MDKNCLFCKIINKEIPSNLVYEDDLFVAFLDINPNNIGHTLLVPKEHSKNIFDIKEKTLVELSTRIKKISVAIKKEVNADGINIIMNNEPAAGQLVFHTHVHIIPRFLTDGFKPWPQKKYKDGEALIVAQKIKENI